MKLTHQFLIIPFLALSIQANAYFDEHTNDASDMAAADVAETDIADEPTVINEETLDRNSLSQNNSLIQNNSQTSEQTLTDSVDEALNNEEQFYQADVYVDAEEEGLSEPSDIGDTNAAYEAESQESFMAVALPGEEIDFKLKLHTTNLHFIDGRAKSDIGKILFKSRLMPSNEVKLSLTLKQREIDDITLTAYFDLANFTMELDGENAVLNKTHKELMDVLNQHLRSEFEVEYRDYDIPEHAFMLVQMLSYWSVSPEGYAHSKREIVANH